MGRLYRQYIDNKLSSIFVCACCKTHLTSAEELVSKSFVGKSGSAYLFDKVCNVLEGNEVKRKMTTGQHIVKDIFCLNCQEYVGWFYEKAFESDQKYKEGKFILEKSLITETLSKIYELFKVV
ncbi:hypothetical protein HDU92_008744 [Lobulomyces angularis]|nr:hypothetical protein HDU92_008744 [Lobulomyces angularis]